MKTSDLISIQKNALGNDTVLIAIVICLLFVCAVKYLFSTNYKFIGNKNEYISFTDDNTILFSFIINGIMVLLMSLLLVSYFGTDFHYFANFQFHYLVNLGITFLLISIIMLLRLFIEIIFYNVFYESSSISFFMKNSSFVNAKNVVLLLILCFLFFYTTINKDYIIIGGFLFLFLSRIVEIYYIYSKQISNNKSTWYYNILYLCTLEILPFIVLMKLLTMGKVI